LTPRPPPERQREESGAPRTRPDIIYLVIISSEINPRAGYHILRRDFNFPSNY
jgi:hypothetical protein